MNEFKLWFKFCFVYLSATGQVTAIAYTSIEPDYKNIIYGSVWKHVIFNPPEDLPDVAQAVKHILSFMKIQFPKAVTQNLTVTCQSRLDLWYSKSDQFPLTMTKFVTARNGDQFPVSVPLSFGSTYNFHLKFSKNDFIANIHFITVTKTLEMGGYHIYAHNFYPLNRMSYKHYSSQCRKFCLKEHLSILSNKASNNKLELTSSIKCDIDSAGHFLEDPIYVSHYLEKHTEGNANFSHDGHLQTNLKVMTYNIWNFNTHQRSGDYQRRVKHISKLLKESQPDIVAFQEVRLETPLGGKLGPCQMDHLISLLPQYQFVYQPAQMQKNSLEQGRTEEGLAIFSKFPIIHHDYLLLFRNQSNSADLNQRICLHAEILIPSFGKVHVFNSHFSLSHEAREVAVKQIQEYMNCFDGRLVLLMGDLNATPKETAIRLLTSDPEFVDVWEHMHPSSDGFTFSCLEDNLSKRIDYILMKKTDAALVEKVKVLHDLTRNDAASDHRALMATFSLKSMNT